MEYVTLVTPSSFKVRVFVVQKSTTVTYSTIFWKELKCQQDIWHLASVRKSYLKVTGSQGGYEMLIWQEYISNVLYLLIRNVAAP